MKKIITSNVVSALADYAIIQEAQQDDIELGHALKNITAEQLKHIFEERECKTIPAEALDELIDFGICNQASREDKELGEALEAISTEALEAIITDKPKVISIEEIISVIGSKHKEDANDEIIGVAALTASEDIASYTQIPGDINGIQVRVQPPSSSENKPGINWTLVFIIGFLITILAAVIF